MSSALFSLTLTFSICCQYINNQLRKQIDTHSHTRTHTPCTLKHTHQSLECEKFFGLSHTHDTLDSRHSKAVACFVTHWGVWLSVSCGAWLCIYSACCLHNIFLTISVCVCVCVWTICMSTAGLHIRRECVCGCVWVCACWKLVSHS